MSVACSGVTWREVSYLTVFSSIRGDFRFFPGEKYIVLRPEVYCFAAEGILFGGCKEYSSGVEGVFFFLSRFRLKP